MEKTVDNSGRNLVKVGLAHFWPTFGPLIFTQKTAETLDISGFAALWPTWPTYFLLLNN